MSQPEKRIKIQKVHTDQLKDLMIYRDEIKRLSSTRDSEIEYLVEDNENENMRIFIQNEIRESENRMNQKLEKIDRKLNLLIDKFIENYQEEESENEEMGEEHVIEYIQEGEESPAIVDEFSNQIFPISDEETFDWFMDRLRDEAYRTSLISLRWELAKNVGTRSFNVAVKDFMLMHFDLAVCIKYSVSGYGSRGTKKKKLDAPTLVKYTLECFNRVNPGVNNYQDVNKAITQFWGRSQDNFTKSTERIVKREYNQKIIK